MFSSLFLLLLHLLGQMQSLMHHEYILYNAFIYTMDPENPIVSSVLVRDGKFVKVADDLEVMHHSIRKINMNQSLILPGLIDSHAHLLLQGYKMSSVDLNGATNVEQVRQRILDFLDQNPRLASNSWIKGMGWDQTLFDPPVFPSAQDLDIDDRLADLPIVLYRVDAHALWTNGKGLELSKDFWKNATNQPDVLVHNGQVQGVFLDNAMDLVQAAIPQVSEEEKYHALDLAIHEMLRFGLTGIHDAGVLPVDIQFFKRAIDKGKFPIRSYTMIYCPDQNLYCGDLVPRQNYKNHLFVKAVKLVADGALGSWGALMLEPYNDNPNSTGILRLTANGSIPGLVSMWLSNGYQVNVHCIGDKANRIILDAFESYHGDLLRSRIEHAQIISSDDIPRFKKLGVIPSMQPTHATSDMAYIESRIGHERSKGAYVWQEFLNLGVEYLPLGSDFPIENVNPLLGMYAAVTRRKIGDVATPSWFPEQIISLDQAIKGFTIDAAYASFLEDNIGSISSGKLADFVVFSKNFLLDFSPEKLLQTEVKATVIDGEVKYGAL